LDSGKSLSEGFHAEKDAQGNAPRSLADYDLYIANSSGKPNINVLKKSGFIYSFDADTWPCFLKIPTNETSAGLRRMEETYSKLKRHLVAEPLQAFAISFSVHSGKQIQTPFPAMVLFMRSTKPECRALNFDDNVP
jgi:hypothetical protein